MPDVTCNYTRKKGKKEGRRELIKEELRTGEMPLNHQVGAIANILSWPSQAEIFFKHFGHLQLTAQSLLGHLWLDFEMSLLRAL